MSESEDWQTRTGIEYEINIRKRVIDVMAAMAGYAAQVCRRHESENAVKSDDIAQLLITRESVGYIADLAIQAAQADLKHREPLEMKVMSEMIAKISDALHRAGISAYGISKFEDEITESNVMDSSITDLVRHVAAIKANANEYRGV